MPKTLLLLTACALAASLGIKAMLPPAARDTDREAAASKLQRLAAERGYAAVLTSAGAGIPLVVARSGGCQRRLFVVDPEGSQNAKVDTLRQPGERHVFHYRGNSRTTFPRFEPVTRNYAQAYLGNLGVAIAVPAIVAELAAGNCRAAPELPFAMLWVAARPASAEAAEFAGGPEL